jgi:ribose transport system permease protein
MASQSEAGLEPQAGARARELDDPATTAPGAPRGGGGASAAVRRALVRVPWILWVLVVICVTFAVIDSSAFLTPSNARNIGLDTSILLVMAVGSTFVITAAGIDLSIGSVLVFSGVVAARILGEQQVSEGLGVLIALGVCLACGAAWGVLNGLIIAYARVNPLITTLGTMGMALGFSLILADDGLDITVENTQLVDIGIGRLFGQIPYLVLIAAVVAVVGGIALAQTRFGRYTAAIGSNREAAERVGIKVSRHLVKVYCLSGVLSGLAGFMSLARFSTTTITGHTLDILQVITGVILGGTSLFGGIGTMLGTVIGMFIPSVLANGLVISGVVPFWQQVVVGAILIAAVYIDQLRRARRA